MDAVTTYIVNIIEKLGISVALIVFGLWSTVRVVKFFAPRIDRYLTACSEKQEKSATDLHQLVETVRHASIQNTQALAFLARSYDDLVNYIKFNRSIIGHSPEEENDSAADNKDSLK